MEKYNEKHKTDNIIYRLAKADDYEEILNINRNIYSGWDYLSELFFHFLHDPKHLQFVAEIDGKIVSYSGTFLTDDNTGCVGISGRTAPEYQGSKMYLKLAGFRMDYLSQKIGDGLIRRWTSLCTSKTEQRILSNPKESIRMYWNFLVYEHENGLELNKQVKSMIFQIDQSLALRLPLAEAMKIVCQPDNVRKLETFGKFIICGAWFPYKVTEENLKLIIKKYNTLFSINQSDRTCDALSTVSTCHTLDGSFRFDVFYHGEPIFQMWRAHFFQHFSHVLDTIPKETKLKIMVHFPEKLLVKTVEDFLVSVLGNRVANTTFHYTVTKALVGERQPEVVSKI